MDDMRLLQSGSSGTLHVASRVRVMVGMDLVTEKKDMEFCVSRYY